MLPAIEREFRKSKQSTHEPCGPKLALITRRDKWRERGSKGVDYVGREGGRKEWRGKRDSGKRWNSHICFAAIAAKYWYGLSLINEISKN